MIKEIKCNKYDSAFINWFDDNNRLVSFDFNNDPNKEFGYKYCKFDSYIDACYVNNSNLGAAELFDCVDTTDAPDLSNAYFAEYQPYAESGKFKIEGSPDCNWLILYNYDDEDYSHDFTFKESGKEVCKGEL